MKKTPRTPSIGCSGWTYALALLQLPCGLEEGSPVSVIGNGDKGDLVVRDARGTQYQLHRAFIDCGVDFELAPGDWRHESDPIVLGKLRQELRQIKACAGCDVHGLGEKLVQISRILARNATSEVIAAASPLRHPRAFRRTSSSYTPPSKLTLTSKH